MDPEPRGQKLFKFFMSCILTLHFVRSSRKNFAKDTVLLGGPTKNNFHYIGTETPFFYVNKPRFIARVCFKKVISEEDLPCIIDRSDVRALCLGDLTLCLTCSADLVVSPSQWQARCEWPVTGYC